MAKKKRIRIEPTSSATVPTYIIPDFKIAGDQANGNYAVAFSVTETPIIPSVNRGRKVANLAGGFRTSILKDEMTRAPLLITDSPQTLSELESYISGNFETIKQVADGTTRYGSLSSLDPASVGNDLYLRIGMFTGDAAGHNMTTKASEAVVQHILKEFEGKIRLGSLSGNYCTDKKPAQVNVDKGRGKTVRAEVLFTDEILESNLRTSGEKLLELNEKKNIAGSKLAGSIAQNAHHANIIGAIYLATGQDIANVVDGSLGKTTVDIDTSEGETLFGVTIPALIVGTVGGGTGLPYAKKHLEIMDCQGSNGTPGSQSKKLAEIIASAVLAGELSLMAALTNSDELIRTHIDFERGDDE